MSYCCCFSSRRVAPLPQPNVLQSNPGSNSRPPLQRFDSSSANDLGSRPRHNTPVLPAPSTLVPITLDPLVLPPPANPGLAQSVVKGSMLYPSQNEDSQLLVPSDDAPSAIKFAKACDPVLFSRLMALEGQQKGPSVESKGQVAQGPSTKYASPIPLVVVVNVPRTLLTDQTSSRSGTVWVSGERNASSTDKPTD